MTSKILNVFGVVGFSAVVYLGYNAFWRISRLEKECNVIIITSKINSDKLFDRKVCPVCYVEYAKSLGNCPNGCHLCDKLFMMTPHIL